jgi:RNA polymerase sigma factor (sigma-70 family)
MTRAQATLVLRHLRRLGGKGVEERSTDAELLQRFIAGHDGEAFSELVNRHGPMVLGVCRSILCHEQDAEDAFQATFLILARKAGSIRHGEALAGFLYEVAQRVAFQARSRATRSRIREQRAQTKPSPDPVLDMTVRELQEVVHEELRRLPEKYRLPLVLCYLEGLSHQQAAAQLGWPSGTFRGRLERGRDRLRYRLERRGVALALAACTTELLLRAPAAPAALLDATTRAALGEAGGVVSAEASTLALQTTGVLSGSKGKLTAGLLLVGALAVAAAGMRKGEEEPMPPQSAPPVAAAAPKSDEDVVLVRGRVLDANGKVVPGARLFVFDGNTKVPAPQRAADSQGRFSFKLELDPIREHLRCLMAVADRHGCDWVPTWTQGEWTLRLPEEVPIRGQVVDLQGLPVADVTVRIIELQTTSSGSLDDFLRVWQDAKAEWFRPFHLLDKDMVSWQSQSLLQPAGTDADGRFTFRGVGRDRVAALRVHGCGIADQVFFVLTRPDFRPGAPVVNRNPLYGPDCRLAVMPDKLITGVVRDRDTGKPVAGVSVSCRNPDPLTRHWLRAVTDAEGRYHLQGLAKRPQYALLIEPPAGDPHLPYPYQARDTEGLDAVTADVGLSRGVVVSGRLTDKVTGKPVRGVVHYRPLRVNEALTRTPGLNEGWGGWSEVLADTRGHYSLTVLPGPGVVLVRAGGVFTRHSYTSAKLSPEDNDPQVCDASSGMFLTAGGDIQSLRNMNAYRVIRAKAEDAELKIDFTLDPGKSRVGKVVDPAGKPLPGAQVMGLYPHGGRSEPLAGADFTAVAIEPGQPRRLVVRHAARKLAGTVVLRGDEAQPVIVKLEPLAAVMGRLLDSDGKPLAGVPVTADIGDPLVSEALPEKDPQPILSDAAGRFHIDGLTAGLKLSIRALDKANKGSTSHVVGGIILSPGKTRDLGDLRPAGP